MEFLETKDVIPINKGPIVESPRRLKALAISLERPLTLVFAPSGYGKTTLCASFCRSLPAGKYKTVWLNLDESDAIEKIFMFNFVSAIHRALPELGIWELLGDRFDDLKDPATAYGFLVPLANTLSRSKKHPYIVLDNYDVLSAGTTAHMRFLARSVASSVSFVVLASSPVGIDFGELMLSGDLVEISTVDLQMTLEESEFFLEENCGIHFNETQLEEICDMTCGCVAALKIVATCFSESGDANGGFANAIERCKVRLQSFALSRLLRMFDEQTVRFLVKMSFAPRFTVGLCSAVSKDFVQRDTITKLLACGVLSETKIGYGSWYSIAKPYEDSIISLRDQYLSHEEREHVCDVLIKWYEDEEMIEEALELMIAQKNDGRFISLFTRNMELLLQRNDGARILEWLGGMSEAAATSNLAMLLASAWGSFTAGQPEEALMWLRYVFAGNDYGHIQNRDENPDYYDLWSLIKTIEACVTSQMGEYEKGIELSKAVLKRLGDTSVVLADRANLWLWVTLWHNLGESYMMTGKPKEALAAFSTSRIDSIVARRPVLYYFCSYEIGYLRLYGGNLKNAGRVFKEALKIGKAGVPITHTWAEGLVHLGVSRLCHVEGRMREAYEEFETAIAMVGESANVDGYLECMMQRCRLEIASGNVDRAHAAICEAYNDAMSVCVPRGVGQDVLLQRVLVEILMGNMSAAQQVLRECEAMIDPADIVHMSKLKGACAYYHALRKEAETALRFVDEALEYAERADCGLHAAENSVLRAALLWDLGRKPEAVKETIGALRALSGMGAVAVWKKYVAYRPVHVVLEKFLRSSDPVFAVGRYETDLVQFAQRSLEFLGKGVCDAGEGSGASESLTPKEASICDMIVEGMTRKEIAEALGVSQNTVKTHMRAVYRKLGVHSVKELRASRGAGNA